MDLILWRHAEAEDAFPDLARALTPKGKKQARQMAAWLKPRLPEDLRVLVSPAKRTLQTAAALDLDFTTCDAIAPGASARLILDASQWPQADGSVLIVGHQPALGDLAALLLTGREYGINVKKGAIWWFAARHGSGIESCVLKAVMTPDMIGGQPE